MIRLFLKSAVSAIPVVGPFIAPVFDISAEGWKKIGIVAAIVAGIIVVDRRATWRERAKCEAAAAVARKQADSVDRGNIVAGRRLDTRIGEALQQHQSDSIADTIRLQQELGKFGIQSTKPGAKNDPNALLDDECNWTKRGRERVWGQ